MNLIAVVIKIIMMIIVGVCGVLTTSNLQIKSFADYENDLIVAVGRIISKGFSSSAVTINFISGLSETKDRHNSLIDNLIAQCFSSIGIGTQTIPSSTVYVEDVNFITQRQRLYNVIFIDGIDSFHRLFLHMTNDNNNFVIDGYYLMILVGEGSIGELNEITKRLWSVSIYNILIIVPNGVEGKDEEKGKVAMTETQTGKSRLSLVTFLPFASSTNCDDSTPVIINIFSNGDFKNNKFFPSKMSDMSQCPIKVVTFNCPPMMVIPHDNDNADVDRIQNLQGIDGEMLKTLSKTLKFSIDLIHFNDDIRWGSMSSNGTATGAMEMIINKEAHLTIGMYTITFLRSKFMTSSEFYYTVPFVLVIPPGKPFTAFEKLFRPFHFIVWALLLSTFVSAIVVITIIKLKRSRAASIYVLGMGNHSPYLNILISFVGGSMTTLPRNNFARTLLMIFLLFSIVKRTIYQAGLFQMIQLDVRHKEIQSIDELVQKNFKVFMYASGLEHTERLKFKKQRVVGNASYVEEMLMKTVDPNFEGVVTSSIERVAYLNKVNSNSTKHETLTVCKEFLFTFQYGIYFQKNSYLTKAFNEKISLLKSSGLIDFWATDLINSKYLNFKISDPEPKKLNLDQTMGGFEILLIGFAIGFSIFSCEILTNRLQIRKLQNLIEFFT